ncbi:hypothetical protein M1N93_03260 [Dehalococcoidia bacterium]|nr:hypothetical protein [Dehalococcoidia bacterium]
MRTFFSNLLIISSNHPWPNCGLPVSRSSPRYFPSCSYRRPDGGTGKAHLEFQVAHRRGESCLYCGSPIQRVSLRGRGTHFCARCQPDGA